MRRILVFLTAGMLAASLAAPALVMAAPFSTVLVPKPNGVNDTAAVQKALDACAVHGPGCTVQLQAGTYHTKQLVEYNFQGTFKGAGESKTTIHALPNLDVDWAIPQSGSQCAPNLTNCLWPNLIMFVNGTIEVSDLSISEPYTGGTGPNAETTGWPTSDFGPPPAQTTLTALYDVLAFTGQHRTDVSVDRVSITGAPDTSKTSFNGYNLANGIDYTGFYPNGSTGRYGDTLTGSFSVRNSSFNWIFNPLSLDGPHRNNQVTIGGAPGAGNSFDNAFGGVDLESAQSSVFDVSYNTSAASAFGMWVSWDNTVPTSPSQYLIHDNTFATAVSPPGCGCFNSGIMLTDNPANPYIQANIWHNTIQLGAPNAVGISVTHTSGTAISDNTVTIQVPGTSNATTSEGIDTTYTTGSLIWGNTITGSGAADAIGLWSATDSLIAGNTVSGVTPASAANGGYAQIYLGTSSLVPAPPPPPASAHDLVVCTSSSDTVLDKGTNDTVTGCTP